MALALHRWNFGGGSRKERCPVCFHNILIGLSECSHKSCRANFKQTWYYQQTKNIVDSIEIIFFKL